MVSMALLMASIPAAVAVPQMEQVIVVLKPGPEQVETVAKKLGTEHAGAIGFVYRHALRGFTMTLPEAAIAALGRNPRVQSIETDQEVNLVGTQPIPTGIDRVDADLNPGAASFPNVDIAIVDTGVYLGQTSTGQARSHFDLNLVYVTDCTSAIFYPTFGGCSGSGNFQDENGHGTHVAGIAAAKDNDIGSIGTAPGAVLWSVKVLNADGTGFLGSLLAGIDFVTSQAHLIEVANMSLGFQGDSPALNSALANATNAGVVFVVAAGNSAADAVTFSPANHPDVITVSAVADFDGKPGGLGTPTCRSDVDDTFADFSNFGAAVDIAAPGVCIFSTWLNDGYGTLSGTSMASPAVAGAVARYIAQSGHSTSSGADVQAIKSALVQAAAPQTSACGFGGDPDSTPEPTLFLNAGLFGGNGTCDSGGPPPNVPPVAGFTSSCSGLSCTLTNTSSDGNGDSLTFLWDFGDGSTSTETNPIHDYLAAGTFGVTLTAADASTSDVEVGSVTVTSANQAPVADFSSSCSELTCNFTNLSSDPEGDSLVYGWDFGDGVVSAEVNPSHTFSAAGTYTVALTASDGSLSTTESRSMTVTPAAPAMTAAVYPILIDGRKATISIDVLDGSGTGVGGATVDGVWTYLDRRGRTLTITQSGLTGPGGSVSMQKTFPRGATVQSYCVTNVTKSGWTYVPPWILCGYPLT